MTLDQIKASDAVKERLALILSDKVLAQVLDAMQAEALPTKITPPLVPGVHYDTTLAQDDRYRAGWSDFAKVLRALPTGGASPTDPIADEEPFAYTEEVQEIDQQLKRQPK